MIYRVLWWHILVVGTTALVILRLFRVVDGEQVVILAGVLVALVGYFCTSEQNAKQEALRHKRELYADFMEGLIIFKLGRADDNVRDEYRQKMQKQYYRAWIEASDDLFKRFDEYAKVYETWSHAKTDENREKEMKAFDDLVHQMRGEVIPKSHKSKPAFSAYVFQEKQKPS